MAHETITVNAAGEPPRQYELGANVIVRLSGDTTGIPSNKGFSVSDTGTVSITPRRGSAVADYPVLAGIIYPLDISAFTQSTSSPATMKLFVHRQA